MNHVYISYLLVEQQPGLSFKNFINNLHVHMNFSVNIWSQADKTNSPLVQKYLEIWTFPGQFYLENWCQRHSCVIIRLAIVVAYWVGDVAGDETLTDIADNNWISKSESCYWDSSCLPHLLIYIFGNCNVGKENSRVDNSHSPALVSTFEKEKWLHLLTKKPASMLVLTAFPLD